MKNIFTRSSNMSREYCCSIVRVGEVIPVEGSDFLGKTIVDGFQIVVRKDEVKKGDIMFYVSNECELNEKFLSINNQFSRDCYTKNSNYKEVQSRLDIIETLKKRLEGITSDENQNATEISEVTAIIKEHEASLSKLYGFFNKNGRVKMITLRKCPSLGYLFSPEAMYKYCPKAKSVNLEDWVDNPDSDHDFDTVNGELFVKAYVPKPSNVNCSSKTRTTKAQKRVSAMDKIVPNEFFFHYDTQMLNKNIHRFTPDSEVYISVKVHGCVERNTVVDTLEYGEKIIGDIVDNKLECHIKAFDVEEDSVVYVPVDNFYFMPNDGEWYEIELEDGKKITITGNNPVWLPLEETYRRAEDLSIGDTLLVD